MSSSPQSTHFHIVISTRWLQDIRILQQYYAKHKSIDKYVISVEKGTTGHEHIESFVTFIKPLRQDKVRDKVIRIYALEDSIDRVNVKVVINKINTDVRYGFGYSWKESPTTYITNLETSYLDECLKYYNDEKDKVEKALATAKVTAKLKKIISIDDVAESFYEFCSKVKADTTTLVSNEVASNAWEMPEMFLMFFKEVDYLIPFSLYQKINHHKLIDYINARMRRDEKRGVGS